MANKALGFAFRLSRDVIAAQMANLTGEESHVEREIRNRWAKDGEAPAEASGLRPPHLLLPSPDYRLMYGPLLKEIRAQRGEFDAHHCGTPTEGRAAQLVAIYAAYASRSPAAR
ncbi:hypothetical protein [Mesorhizobium sp. NFR06]|jgi:hypothetical protein|uniref:hypothetical protein n=1 Tax=Mesorhizobium sp. NFR06 TaxID=1566290 RepID=UPI00122D7069|nr:hypothetical protein [Mesorhizobium sp. NFR06]